MSDNSVETTVYQRMIAGGVAGFASQFFVYPLDTLKTRMMAEMSAQIIKKKNIDSSKVRVKAYKVAKTMFQKEGIRSFYRGVGPSLLGYNIYFTNRIVPYASIDLTAYETLKLTYIKFRPDNEPSPVVHLVCGAFSGALSSSIIYPLGLVRTRYYCPLF